MTPCKSSVTPPAVGRITSPEDAQPSVRADRRTTDGVGVRPCSVRPQRERTWLSSCVVTFTGKKDLDAEVIALLVERDGMPTVVRLVDGRTVTVWNVAGGYDLGDEYAHVTSNCSPYVDQHSVDFFYTSEVVEIRDRDGGSVLLSHRL